MITLKRFSQSEGTKRPSVKYFRDNQKSATVAGEYKKCFPGIFLLKRGREIAGSQRQLEGQENFYLCSKMGEITTYLYAAGNNPTKREK